MRHDGPRSAWRAASLAALAAALTLAACAPASTAPGSAPPPAAATTGAAPPAATKPGAAASAPAPAPPAAPTPRPTERIAIGSAGKTLDILPIYVAQAHGLFAEEGLAPEVTIARSDVAVSATVARELDYTTNVQAALGAAVGGAPFVAVYSLKENLLIYLIGQPHVTDAAGLRGGTVGHGGTRGADWAATVEMLRHLGLEAGRDVQLISTSDSAGGLAALLSGAVAATALRPPQDSVAVKEGYQRLVAAPSVLEPVPDTAVITHRQKLQENPDQVRRVIRALLRGTHLMLDRPDDAVAVVQREFELEPATARIAYDALRSVYNLEGEASEESLQAAIRRALAAGDLRQTDFAPRDFVDWTFLREVRRGLNR